MNGKKPVVLFASWHFYLDQSNGASISTRALLLELARRGWQVKTLCAFAQDYQRRRSLEETFAFHCCRIKKRIRQKGCDVVSFEDRGAQSLVVLPEKRATFPSSDDCATFRRLLRETLARCKPDMVITYGGYALGPIILRETRAFGARAVVFLHNLAYSDARYFRDVDLVFVPSRYAEEDYRRRLGLASIAIPPLIEPLEVAACESTRDDGETSVLFVNPEVGKGVGFLIALVEYLAVRRPDIRFLVAEGREGSRTLLKLGAERLKDVRNVEIASNTRNLRALFSRAKVTLMPSLYRESFGRVAAESISSGTPVIASTRGALPEVVGEAGILLDVPERYAPDAAMIPAAEEISPWADATIRLWDDDRLRERLREKGREQAKTWEYARVADAYEERLLDLLKTTAR